MDLAVLEQLQTVLDRSQKPVRLRQALRVPPRAT